MHVCMYSMCMPGAHRGHNGASDPLVDLEMVVSTRWVLRIKLGLLGKQQVPLTISLAHLSSPNCTVLCKRRYCLKKK